MDQAINVKNNQILGRRQSCEHAHLRVPKPEQRGQLDFIMGQHIRIKLQGDRLKWGSMVMKRNVFPNCHPALPCVGNDMGVDPSQEPIGEFRTVCLSLGIVPL